ncbi:fimbria/pilus periplasmic chaperone [Vibrio cholerae]|nr:fimbria/pilus periplasmic chaperone [Vibrio cholerae]EJL9424210.1 fimbria/pilus periplasmic chaperone [Vibrio cholerae]EJN2400232.1 fimbria/pilus periplasmic chaperone [Vibrio cholerae]EJN3353174.1 fimbria/pilus periplasmic chaperone [Vibrio cholerae]EKB0632937.1 fimbria/pilus periplasmic chaperone [Vibrio cholerae]
MINKLLCSVSLLLTLLAGQAQAAVSLDRTRVIYPGEAKSMSLTIRNNNKTLPYLAQAWLEDSEGNKINSPFTVLPPVQRLEPGAESLIKIQALPMFKQLPQDRESLFYFSLREVPPRSDKPNTLQLALQTRIKFFYRPASLLIEPGSNKAPWQEKLTLQQVAGKYQLNNPTPYYVTIVAAATSVKNEGIEGFEAVMIAPNSSVELNVSTAKLGANPTFTYVDDFGGRRTVSYQCANSCRFVAEKEAK